MSDLNFDKVEPPAEAAAASPAQLTCVVCNRAVQGSYFEINGRIVDAACKTRVEASREGGSPAQRLLAASLFGVAAAVVGAAIYGAITTATGWNIGLVSILVGYMVGGAVRRGAGGRGGLGYQALAVGLTYVAVAWSYIPQLLMGLTAEERGVGTILYVFFYSFVLPVVEPLMSLPGGLLSLLITFFGVSRAWRMNAAPAWDVKGPFTAP